ncbi:unnamed protein product [Urochloa humidicola]
MSAAAVVADPGWPEITGRWRVASVPGHAARLAKKVAGAEERFLHHTRNSWISSTLRATIPCCSDDTDGKGEDEGQATGKDKAPPWELNLTLQDRAED